jgi:hypothetical protein
MVTTHLSLEPRYGINGAVPLLFRSQDSIADTVTRLWAGLYGFRTFCPHSTFTVFYMDLRANSDYLPIQFL